MKSSKKSARISIMSKLSREPYKGTRDFYPEDMAFQKWLFAKMREVCESYGYVEYGASPLEPAELYAAKTGEEIVNEQTYTFEDRGGRKVTLRPEMTPTVARMIAARRRELPFPLRWYSIPNVFRYEQPQKGRLREHYQLNVDIFGVKNVEADIEIISVAYNTMRALGAKDESFEIRINNRKLLVALNKHLGITGDKYQEFSKLLDKKDKIYSGEFEKKLKDILGGGSAFLLGLLSTGDLESFINGLPKELQEHESIKEIEEVLIGVKSNSPKINIKFSPTLMRGFDYYTGTVFEVFDTSGENKRSLFGGGRYDELLSIFDEEEVPAVGFGMGDVTIRDFLETHKLLPKIESSNKVSLCLIDNVAPDFVNETAKTLRKSGVNVSIDWSQRKIGDQIKSADKARVPYIIVLGDDEVKTNTFTLKNLATGEETRGEIDKLSSIIKNSSI